MFKWADFSGKFYFDLLPLPIFSLSRTTSCRIPKLLSPWGCGGISRILVGELAAVAVKFLRTRGYMPQTRLEDPCSMSTFLVGLASTGKL